MEAVVMPLIILKPALEQIEVQHSHKVVEASEEQAEAVEVSSMPKRVERRYAEIRQ
jgi:hypothetical protein